MTLFSTFKRLGIACLLALLLGAFTPAVADSPVSVELLAEHRSVRAGQPMWVAIRMELEEGWHAYWKNPGDAGMPPRIDWNLPPGWTAGQLQWPYPERFTDEMGVSYGYEGTTVILAELTPPSQMTSATIDLAADVNWLVCGTSCRPGFTAVELTLPVTDGVPRIEDDNRGLFAAAREHLPQKTAVLTVQTKGNSRQILLPESTSSDLKEVYLFASESQMLPTSVQQHLVDTPNGKALELSGEGLSDIPLSGVLVMATGNGMTQAIHVEAIDAAMVETAGASMTFALALLMAFAGGLILNLMPCVLPVIAFKIMSFVKLSGESRLTLAKHGFAFFSGALISFWVLAGILLAFRAYGQTLGWGFQLQSPLFVAVLAMVLTVFGMSLFGLFEMGASLSSAAGAAGTKSLGLLGSFSNGVLATAVATPCTGPLLGTTLGFAVTLSNVQAMLIFSTMGIGMAIPYLLLALFPSLLRFLPKPGPWMVVFKEAMGFLIIGTVVWLVWVFGAQTSINGATMLLSALLLATLGCWVYGKWGSMLVKRSVRLVSTTITVAILAVSGYGAYTASLMVEGCAPIAQGEKDSHGWVPYSKEHLAQLLDEGRPVFVDFTAKWCMICQYNKAVLHSEEVSRRFMEQGVVCMYADWTRRDAEITEALASFGRNGVPLYVLYGTDGNTRVLPQTLTSDSILAALDELSGELVQHVADTSSPGG